MFRWRMLKSLAVIFPLFVLLASPFLEPVRRKLLNRSDLRLFTSRDLRERTQTVIVHNSGDAPLRKVFVGISIAPNIDKPISDFYYASNASAPAYSFVDALARSDTWNQLAPVERDTIASLVDDHSRSRTLYDVDAAFDSFLGTSLKTNKVAAKAAGSLTVTGAGDDWHGVLIKQCESNQSLACPEIDKTIKNWELSKRILQTDTLRRWQEVTAVEVIPPGRKLSPNGILYFAFSLGPDESGFLRIKYGPNPLPVHTPIVYSNPQRDLTKVERSQDLFASSLWVFWYYYPSWTGFWIVLILVCLYIAWPVIRPASLLPTHKVFNLAIKTNDPEHWQLASLRHKYNIFAVYRVYWERFKQTDLKHSPEEMFEFIKSCSLDEREDNAFKNDSDLNRFVERKLEQLTRLP